MRQNTPLEPARRAPDLYAEGLAHQVNAPLLLIVVFPCVNEEKQASIPMFFPRKKQMVNMKKWMNGKKWRNGKSVTIFFFGTIRRQRLHPPSTWAASTRPRPICGWISALSQCAFVIDLIFTFYFYLCFFYVFWWPEKKVFVKKKKMLWKNEWMVKNEEMMTRGPFFSS